MRLAVKHGILGILADHPCHGYELKAGFDLLTGSLWELNIGQIYSTLERLLKEGLVVLDPGEEAEAAGEPDRKVYRITPAGLVELDVWLQRPPLKAKPVRDEIFVRLGLLVDRDRPQALALIAAQRLIYQQQLAELTRRKIALARQGRSAGADQAPDIRQELLLDAALLHVDADLKWLERCEERLAH